MLSTFILSPPSYYLSLLQSVSLVHLRYSPEKMSILFSQSGFALSLKVIFISTSVLSAAVLLKLSVPAIADFAVTDVPSIYNVVVSWLRPPYLYLVINCIIITIVASTKLQSKVDDVTLSPSPAPQLEATAVPVPVHPQPVVIFPEPVKEYCYDAFTVNRDAVEAVKLKPEVFDYSANNFISNDLNHYQTMVLEADKEFVNVNAAVASTEGVINNYSEEALVAKSSPSPSPITRRDSSDFSFSNEKPPVSKRIGHRRAVKASPEGGKTALGVSKSKRQDTLESTWKTITEGRAMPLTRHLRKSDTWETNGGRHHNHTPEYPKMMKSETVKEHNNDLLLSPSPGSGKLKKEPSLGQDELNRRVEAFIKKFNEEMRLQRQESLNQYMEMINRGAH